MKYLLLAIGLLFLSAPAIAADTLVNGYYKSNGSYVKPHFRSKANNTTYDNYSTRGNTNPYTGRRGTKTPKIKGSSLNFNSNRSNNGW